MCTCVRVCACVCARARVCVCERERVCVYVLCLVTHNRIVPFRVQALSAPGDPLAYIYIYIYMHERRRDEVMGY